MRLVHCTQCAVLRVGGTTYGLLIRRRRSPCRRRRDGTAIRDSLETAFAKGNGKCFAFVEEKMRSKDRHALLRGYRGAESQSTAERGGGSHSAAAWPAAIAALSIFRLSRGCSASTARWGPVRNARALAALSSSTAGGATVPVRRAAARGCGRRRWTRGSADETLPRFAAMQVGEAAEFFRRLDVTPLRLARSAGRCWNKCSCAWAISNRSGWVI